MEILPKSLPRKDKKRGHIRGHTQERKGQKDIGIEPHVILKDYRSTMRPFGP